MSALRKKTEFYKGESDREVIVIAAEGLGEGAPPAGRFSHYGSLPSHQIFSYPHEILSSHYCYLKWTQNELILKATLRKFSACGEDFYDNMQFKTFNPSFQQNF